MSKLTALHINLIGGIVGLLVLPLALWYFIIKPLNENIETTRSTLASTEQAGGTEQMVQQKQNELKKTQLAEEQANKDWKRYSNQYMPPLDFSNKDKLLNYYGDVLVRMPSKWGQYLDNWYDRQRNQSVARMNAFPIPAFPADPNVISKLTHITFPADDKTWDVIVKAKSFDAAMAHLRRFNDGMDRGYGVPVVSNVALTGQSPDLFMTYNLKLHIIPPKPPAPLDPILAAPSDSGGGGGRYNIPGAPGGNSASRIPGG